MSRLRLLIPFACVLACSPVLASSFIATTDSLAASLINAVDASSDASSSLLDDKRVRAARDEAASFVASAGALRGARLEAALRVLRGQVAGDDLQLAQAILAR